MKPTLTSKILYLLAVNRKNLSILPSMVSKSTVIEGLLDVDWLWQYLLLSLPVPSKGIGEVF